MEATVLIVDDSAVNRFMLSQLVRSKGCQVCEVSGGQAAIDLVSSKPVDLVLLDIRMPEVDGFAVLEFIKAHPELNHVPVIMVSSLDDLDATVRCIEMGAEDYLMKPFQPTLLGARLRACLERKQVLEELLQLKKALQLQNDNLEIANRRLEELAFTDPLTGVPNRRFALDALNRHWSQAHRNGRPLACLLGDVDFFKKVNDSFGHDCGDQVICRVAQTLNEEVRASDIVCRFGGEEFIIICPDTDTAAALLLGERLVKAMDNQFVEFGEHQVRFTLSLGVAEKLPSLEHWNQLVTVADEALYAAKHAGRNCVRSLQEVSH